MTARPVPVQSLELGPLASGWIPLPTLPLLRPVSLPRIRRSSLGCHESRSTTQARRMPVPPRRSPLLDPAVLARAAGPARALSSGGNVHPALHARMPREERSRVRRACVIGRRGWEAPWARSGTEGGRRGRSAALAELRPGRVGQGGRGGEHGARRVLRCSARVWLV